MEADITLSQVSFIFDLYCKKNLRRKYIHLEKKSKDEYIGMTKVIGSLCFLTVYSIHNFRWNENKILIHLLE